MAHWREVLPPDRLVEVDYEALVGDPEPQTRRLERRFIPSHVGS
jgi:hypothetical protein